MEQLEQLKQAREQVAGYLSRVQDGGRYVDFDNIIVCTSNLLNELLYNNAVGSRAEWAMQHYIDEELINMYIKHKADEGDYRAIKYYLQDVTSRSPDYYVADDNSVQDVTADDLETWLMDILDNLDSEIENFKS